MHRLTRRTVGDLVAATVVSRGETDAVVPDDLKLPDVAPAN